MEDCGLIHQWQDCMSSLDNSPVDGLSSRSFPSSCNMTNLSYTLNSEPHQASEIRVEKEMKQVSSTIISFTNIDSPRGKFLVKPEMESLEIMSLENISSSSVSMMENLYSPLGLGNSVARDDASRRSSQAQEHVLAERKRRERMTQRFIALSAVIPGLKRLDKATVLGGAINYIKELQERVKKLEEEAKKKDEKPIAKRPRLSTDADGSSSDKNFDSSSNQLSPEIEVRASEGNVLLRVYCKNQTGIIKEIFSEIERHHLTMISSSAIPFGDNRLQMTIIAQMADQNEITATTLEDNLRMAIANLLRDK